MLIRAPTTLGVSSSSSARRVEFAHTAAHMSSVTTGSLSSSTCRS